MRITVKLGAPLSKVVGESKVTLSMSAGATVADVLDALRARYPDFQEGLKGKGLRRPPDRVPYTLFVNARSVSLERAETIHLRDGDQMYLFLPAAGG